MHLLLQFFSYSVMTWLFFVAVAFCFGRYLPWWCIPFGQIVVAVVICWQDVNWVQAEMRKPRWDGTPDLDMIFMFGLLIRIVLINIALLPISLLGVWLRRQGRRI